MKKIIYSLLFIGLLFTGCISYEEYSSEELGGGPSVEITVSAVQDNSFVASISPASGTKYYAYWIVQSDAETDINAESLLKTSYSGSKMVDASEASSVTLTTKADPFTTYQVYAVAANDKGVLGEVSHQTVFTTDGTTPIPTTFQQSTANRKLVQVVFNEAIKRGTGNVSITYIKNYDPTHPETVVVDDEFITVSGSAVVFEVPEPTPGVWFAISWATGAFVDVADNATQAFNSGLNSSGQFYGIYARIPTVPFAIADENLVESPVYFFDWESFEAEWTFDFNIYPNRNAQKGAIQVVYSSNGKTTIVDIDPASWTISEKSITIKLPEAPQLKDGVSFIINTGVFYDVYGNPNDKYEQGAVAWYYDQFEKEDFIGTFQFTYGSAYEDPEEIFDGGTFSIEEDPETPNGVILKDFYLEGSEIEATYNAVNGKLFVPDLTIIGLTGDYLLATYNLEVDGPIEFQVQGDRSLVCPSMFGVVAADPETGALLGYWDQFIDATFTPVPVAAASLKSSKAFGKSSGRLHPATLKAKKK
jgi:hypothetical protein